MRRFALLASAASFVVLAPASGIAGTAAPTPFATPKPKPTPAPSPRPGGTGGHVKPFSGVSGGDLPATRPSPTPTPGHKHPH